MRKDRPFKTVNTITQGFAVAGPSSHPGIDLEFIYWGLTPEDAKTKAINLNENPKLKRTKD